VKKNAKPSGVPRDTPATRKHRLQQRLKELSDQSDQELTALMQSLEKVKESLKLKSNKS
jgi:hypothetical protein